MTAADDQRDSTTTAVGFYWRPGCPFCVMLRARLAPTGLPLREVNIWDDHDAAARVRAVADGNETVPTVFVGEYAMVNPSPNQVLAAVREHAPALLPARERPTGWRRLLPRRW